MSRSMRGTGGGFKQSTLPPGATAGLPYCFTKLTGTAMEAEPPSGGSN